MANKIFVNEDLTDANQDLLRIIYFNQKKTFFNSCAYIYK